MTTLLSSRLTFFMKVIFPIFWGGIWSWGTGQLFTDPASVHFSLQVFFVRFGWEVRPTWVKWLFVGGLFVGSFLCARVLIPLKAVTLDGDVLRISNFLREIRVPIEDVTDGGFESDVMVNGRSLVVLRFRSETAFGRSIEFVPRSRGAISLLRTRLGPVVKRSVAENDVPESELRGRRTV